MPSAGGLLPTHCKITDKVVDIQQKQGIKHSNATYLMVCAYTKS